MTTMLALGAYASWAVAADESLVARGERQWAEGRVAEARASFEQAARTDPKSVAPLLKLGGLQLTNREPAAAIQTYQRAISLDGANARAWIGLGLAYLHAGQKELARAAFGEAIRVDPSRKAQLASLAEPPAGDERPQ
ncbi:MAG TPA: tetratricopeptide repeat protein [Rhodocyclaceae bacterium]